MMIKKLIEIAEKEFQLNVKHQHPNIKYPCQVLCVWLDNPLIIIGCVMIPSCKVMEDLRK